MLSIFQCSSLRYRLITIFLKMSLWLGGPRFRVWVVKNLCPGLIPAPSGTKTFLQLNAAYVLNVPLYESFNFIFHKVPWQHHIKTQRAPGVFYSHGKGQVACDDPLWMDAVSTCDVTHFGYRISNSANKCRISIILKFKRQGPHSVWWRTLVHDS